MTRKEKMRHMLYYLRDEKGLGESNVDMEVLEGFMDYICEHFNRKGENDKLISLKSIKNEKKSQ